MAWASSWPAASAKLASSAGRPSRLASARRARHGLVPTPPSASRTSATVPSSTRDRGRDRGQRELIRLAVTELQVDRAARHRSRRDLDRGDQLAVVQRMLPIGGIAGQEEEVVDADGPLPARPAGVHHRVQRDQRDRDVRRMRGDACAAGAEDGVAPVHAIHRARSRCPDRACCTATPRHGSSCTAPAGTGCRPSRPCSAAAPRRPAAAPARSPGTGPAPPAPGPHRSSAPALRSAGPPPGRSSTLASGRSLMSTSSPGRSTSWRIRSTSVVPPARNALSGCPATSAIAAPRIGRPRVAERPHYRSPPAASRTSRIAARMFGYAAQRQILPLIHSAISASSPAWPSFSRPPPT